MRDGTLLTENWILKTAFACKQPWNTWLGVVNLHLWALHPAGSYGLWTLHPHPERLKINLVA